MFADEIFSEKVKVCENSVSFVIIFFITFFIIEYETIRGKGM